jgi:uncharacterized protein with PQ loop repeat
MNKTLKSATALVLVGLTFMWFGMVIANYIGLLENPIRDQYGNLTSGTDSILKVSTYVFLLSLLGLAFFSAWAYRKADVQLAAKTEGSLPVFRFTTVGVIVSLVSLALFAIICFFASFNSYQFGDGPVQQFLGVYLPILLAAAGCIYVLLAATVYRKSNVPSSSLTAEERKTKREAALAFIYPILGTTLALIIGLVVYQARRENPQVWVWVLILAIVGSSIVTGMIYAARTKAHATKPSAKPVRVQGTAALNLNLVLVVLFIVVVTVMSFTFGISAVHELDVRYDYMGAGKMQPITFNWFMKSMLPAMLILALVDVSAYIAVRIRSIIASK